MLVRRSELYQDIPGPSPALARLEPCIHGGLRTFKERREDPSRLLGPETTRRTPLRHLEVSIVSGPRLTRNLATLHARRKTFDRDVGDYRRLIRVSSLANSPPFRCHHSPGKRTVSVWILWSASRDLSVSATGIWRFVTYRKGSWPWSVSPSRRLRGRGQRVCLWPESTAVPLLCPRDANRSRCG